MNEIAETFEEARSPSPWERFSPLLLAVAALALHAPSLRNGLTNWDDAEYVEQNAIASQGLAGIPDAFTQTFDGAYYPLTQTAYAIIHQFAGTSALAHHLVSWLLFALAAALLPGALAAFRVPGGIAFAAGLLWIAHPFRVESVAWAANLKDPLSLVFVLATFVLLGRGRWWLAAGAFAAAVLSKSMVFPVAALVPLSLMLRGERLPRAIARALPFLLIALGTGVAALVFHLTSRELVALARPGDGTLLGAVPTMAWLPWWYLGRILWPIDPQAMYLLPPIGWTDWRLVIAVVGYGVVGVGVFVARGARLRLFTGVLAYLVPFATVTGAVPMAFQVADRYTLLPTIPLAVAIAWVGHRLLSWQAGLAPLVCAGLLAVLGYSTVRRTAEWRDGIALFEANRRADPTVPAARYNLAGAYGGAARWDDAISELHEVRMLTPGARRIIGDLFFAYAARDGMTYDLIDTFMKGLERERWSPDAQLRLARRMLAEKRFEIVRFLASSVLRDGDNSEAHLLWSKAAAAQERWDEAAVHAQRALDLDPESDAARIDLVIALAHTGDTERALRVSQAPAGDARSQALLLGARGFVLFKMGREAEATELLERARQELGQAPF